MNSTTSTTRERQLGRRTASTGLVENFTPFEAATRALLFSAPRFI